MNITTPNKSLLLKKNLVVLLFVFGVVLFSFSNVQAATLNDATWHFNGERYPLGTFTYISDNNNGTVFNLTQTSLSIQSTVAKVGNWAYLLESGTEYLYNAAIGSTADYYTVSNWSYAAWVRPESDGQLYNYTVFNDAGGPDNDGIYLYFRDNGSIEVWVGDGTGVPSNDYWRINKSYTNNTWQHIAFNVNTDGLEFWYNGVLQNISATVGVATGGYSCTIASCGNDLYVGIAPHNTIGGTGTGFVYVDEFLRYETQLTQSNVNSLYASGSGYNPYSNETPEQTASIAPIALAQQRQQTVDFGDFFNFDTYFTINFSYNSASYGANQNTSANTGDFAIEFNDATEVTFYSFSADVQTIPITLNACNANGCTTVIIYFSVGAVTGAGLQQIASVAPITINEGETKYRYFTDYFTETNTADLYFGYWDLSGNPQSINTGTATIGSCLNVTISGILVTLQGLSDSCVIQAQLIGVNGSTTTRSNVFSITNTAGADSPTSNEGSLANKMYGWLPDADTLTTQQKLFYVIGFFFAIILGGAVIVLQGGGATAFFLPMLAAALLFIFIFFTSIGYIPAWIAVLLVLGVVFFAIAKARSYIGGV